MDRIQSIARYVSCLSLLVAAVGQGSAQRPPEPSEREVIVRVFRLDRLATHEALTLLRREVAIRSAATLDQEKVVLVGDVAAKVEGAEGLLREQDPGLLASDPHGPLDLDTLSREPVETRVFPIAAGRAPDAMTLLRAIYRIREQTDLPEGGGLAVQAAPPVLDAIGATLRELDLLAG